MITIAILAFLVIFSLCIGFVGSSYYDFKIQLNTFSTAYYTLGCIYRQYEGMSTEEEDDSNPQYLTIDNFTVGFIFIEFDFKFYKFPKK